MTPADTTHLRRLVLEAQTAPWPVAAVRAKAALSAAMEQYGEELLALAQRGMELPPDRPVGQLCADADYGRGRRQRQAGYARKHEAKRREGRALAKAQAEMIETLIAAQTFSIERGSTKADVVMTFASADAASDFYCALGEFSTALMEAGRDPGWWRERRAGARRRDHPRADAELLDAAE